MPGLFSRRPYGTWNTASHPVNGYAKSGRKPKKRPQTKKEAAKQRLKNLAKLQPGKLRNHAATWPLCRLPHTRLIRDTRLSVHLSNERPSVGKRMTWHASPSGRQTRGSVGPKIANVCTPAMAATCVIPVSLPM